MSVETIFNFNSSSDYDYDIADIDIVSGKASLRLQPISVPFSQDFSSSAGFIYDASKTEFVGGAMRQKDMREAHALCAATFNADQHLVWGGGALTGTLLGTTVVLGGKLNSMAAGGKGVWYDDINNSPGQSGAVRFRYTPAISGSPSEVYDLFSLGRSSGTPYNRLLLLHRPGSTLRLYVDNSAGGSVHSNVQIGAAWNPAGGQEYEFELNFDCTLGEYRLFIDGALHGAVLTGTCTRIGGLGRKIVFGNDESFSYNFSGILDDIEIFDAVRHTIPYTSGYIILETIYGEDTITLPETAYTGPGSLLAVESMDTDETGTPRYTIQIDRSGDFLYWNGSAHVVSNGSYAQANTVAEANAHFDTLDVLGALYGQLRAHWTNGNNRQSILDLDIVITGQKYSSSNPTIDTIVPIRNDGLDDFRVTTGGTGSVRYVIKRGSAWVYWNGALWITSDGSYSQSNTAQDISTNAAQLSRVINDLRIRSFLHSDSLQKVEIDAISVTTDFSPIPPGEKKVIVWINGRNVDGEDLGQSETIRLSMNRDAVRYGNGIIIDGTPEYLPFDVDGYLEMDLYDTTSMEAGAYYVFEFKGRAYRKTIPDTFISSSMFDLPDAIV